MLEIEGAAVLNVRNFCHTFPFGAVVIKLRSNRLCAMTSDSPLDFHFRFFLTIHCR